MVTLPRLLSRSAAAALLLLAGACASRSVEPWQPDPAFFAEATPPPATPTPAVSSPAEPSAESNAGDPTPPKSFLGRLFSGSRAEQPAPPPSASADPAEVPVAPTPAPNVYRLNIGDTVYITLSGSMGPTEQIESVVDDRGFVKLRFIGAVRAEGRTATELEREIEAEYTDRQNIFKEIYARVVVPNTFYFIGGEIRQPGRFPLVGRVTLSQAVVAAGNFTEWANPRRLVIVRDNERMEINFRDIRNNPSLDVELRAGDVITVERSTL